MVFGKTINQLTVARQLRNYTSFPFNYLHVNKPRQGKCTTILSEQQIVAKLLTVFQKVIHDNVLIAYTIISMALSIELT